MTSHHADVPSTASIPSLPYASACPASQGLRASENPPIRVLVLEDDADTREVLELLLSSSDGFEMVGCADVETCVELLATATEASSFDVLLLDLLLADGRLGTEVLEIARRDLGVRLPPVIVCTAVSDRRIEQTRPSLMEAHAYLLPKPFEIDALLALLRELGRSATCE